jgi:cell cycle sensor histidine kinase DivJ
LRQIDWVTPARDYVDRLIHPSVRPDPLVAARHRAFVVSQLALSLIALACFPGYLAMRGSLTLVEAFAFALLAAPMLVVLFLSRTGRFAVAQALSAATLGLLIILVASESGGMASFALAWAIFLPIEASLSGSRRVIAVAAGIAGLAILAVSLLQSAGVIEPPSHLAALPAVHAAALLAAVAYAGSVAFAAQRLEAIGVEIARSGEARYIMLAENMNDLVTRHGANGQVSYASPAARPLLGVAPETLSGQGLFGRVHVSDRPLYLSALSRAMSDGEPTSAEFRLRGDDDGEPRFVWVEMRCRPIASNEARHVVAVMRDISARKAHEAEIEAARAGAEKANAAKSRFLATMSHELRTPLNAVIGFSEMLVNEEAMKLDQRRRQDYAQLIHDSGHHLLGVVNGILDMSKIESGTFSLLAESFSLKELVQSCRAMMLLKAESGGIKLAATVESDLPDIVADKRACRQIYLNLMSNALKFTATGGCVIVGARREKDGVALFVADTGVGIAGEDLPRLGEAFFQASSAYDRAYEGTGLGLSVVKGLAELHGGRLEVRSTIGKGTTVTVLLPLDCEAVQRGASVERLPLRDPAEMVEDTTGSAGFERGKRRA